MCPNQIIFVCVCAFFLCVQGKKKQTSKEYFFGPILLTKKDKLFREYYGKELKSREILISLLPKSYRFKRFKIKKEIKLIRENI